MEKEALRGDDVPMPQKPGIKPFLRQLFVVLGVALNMTSVGCAIGYPAVLLPQLRSNTTSIPITKDDASWIASILGLAITNGNLLVPYLLFKFGRRVTNVLSTFPILAGWAFIVSADSVPLLILGRYLQGLGMGLQAPTAPISIGEYTSPKNRGAFLSTISLSLSAGMLVIHLIGTFADWKTTGIICAFFSVGALVIMLFSPETPTWLASKGKFTRCRESFVWLRGTNDASSKELESMISSQVIAQKAAAKEPKKSFLGHIRFILSVFGKREFIIPVFIMFFLFFLFQFSGTNVIPSYTVDIMEAIIGEGKGNPYLGMLVIDVVRFVTSIVAIAVIRKLKRRTVLFLSSSLTILFLLATALYMYLRDLGYIHLEHSWIPISTTILYIIVLTIGISAIPWAIAGEIYPVAYKPIGSALSGIFVSSLLFAAVKTAPYLFAAIHVQGAFVFYAGATLVCVLFLHFLLPETKGKTLQEIENHFKGVKGEGMEAQREGMLLNGAHNDDAEEGKF